MNANGGFTLRFELNFPALEKKRGGMHPVQAVHYYVFICKNNFFDKKRS